MNFVQGLLMVIGMTLATLAQAQQVPQIWIPPSPELKPIVLDEVRIAVTMRGFLAHTRIEMAFDNPNPRVLEGEFVFPLGPGQTVSGYALEVDGAMREGVVVGKQTARVAFEDTSRRQIDPGLAELTRGNVFRTRLYPIPAHGKKRIALEFEQVMDDAGSHWRYLMPLQFRAPVRHFSVRAEAPLDAKAPEVATDSPDATLHFQQTASVWRAELTRENITPQRELAFRVPKQASDVTALEAPDRLEPARRALLARIDTGRPTTLAPPPKPRRIALYFDASGSAGDRDLERERTVLGQWLATLDEVEVELIAFRDVAEPRRSFSLRKGDASALIAALASLPLDGASNYGAIDFRATPKADLALVIGDGLDTWGKGTIDFGGAPARLFVLHAAQRADHARLAGIARRGGQVLDLTRIDAAQAIATLAAPAWRLLSIETDGQCDEIGPLAPQAVEGSLTLTATCTGKATLTLRFGSDDGRDTVERRLVVGAAEPASGALADSVWRALAQARIERLQAEPKPDVAAITELATRHGVVTPYTSLLVLDRIEDYVNYRVEPKEPALRAEYARRIATMPKRNESAGRDAHLQDLARRWQAFRTWHAQRHPWLETLLVPAAAAERDIWRQLAGARSLPEKELVSGRKQLEDIAERSAALAERWLREGAEAASRAAWEREATALMLRLDALRTKRLEATPDLASIATSRNTASAPESIDEPLSEAMMEAPSPVPAPPAPAIAPTDSMRVAAVAAPTQERTRMAGAPVADAAPPAPPAYSADIKLAGWNPDTPWLKALRASHDRYATYLELRRENATTPSFFLDAADFFRDEAKDEVLALRVLSNLAEIGDENTALLRILGYRLVQWNQPALAIRPFEDALEQRPEEPQSHRDLALALARLAQPETRRAAQLLWTVASGEWSSRFPEIDLIALHELTALIAGAGPGFDAATLGIPAELLAPVEVGLRVVLTWDADNTDIDLHVIDPVGEEVYYSHPHSQSGGGISRDFTQGYGPEVFTIARPLPGTYRVQTNYFGDRRQSLTGPVTVQLEFQTGFGSHEPRHQSTTRRLATSKERIDIGQFRVAP